MIDSILSLATTASVPTVGAGGATQDVAGSDGVASRRSSSIAVDGPVQDFTSVLAQVALNAVDSLKSAEATSLAGIRGQAPVQQVVESVMGAEQTLQSAIAIRDKVVAAYLELSRMQI
jgi:flagellar hook-basal body complex protein FliE